MTPGTWKYPAARTASPMWWVTSRYRRANTALWSQLSESDCRRFAISRATESTHCGLPALQMLFGSAGVYGPAREGSMLDQSRSVLVVVELTVVVVVDTRSADAEAGAKATLSEASRATRRGRGGRAMQRISPPRTDHSLVHTSTEPV